MYTALQKKYGNLIYYEFISIFSMSFVKFAFDAEKFDPLSLSVFLYDNNTG